jgi:hypothetical protein
MKKLIISGLLLIAVLASCDRTRSSTGWDYAPDMYYSEAYETNTPNPNFEDGLTMRTPVKGTIPRDMIPFDYEKTDEDRIRAGKELVNPIEVSEKSLERGAKAYEIFCISCHGETGDGQGYLFTSKRYPYPPASLISDKVKALTDGEIYHSVTVGYGIMGAYGPLIRQEDRWKIILHLRENLQK